VVNSQHPAKTFQSFVDYARKNQQKLSISSSSSGVTLMAEALKRKLGFPEAVIATYKGGPYQAVLTGETDMTLDAFNAIALIKAGKLRALAIMAPQRSPDLPDVPTLDELGHKGLHFSSWTGLLAPAATPKDVVDRIHAATKAVLDDPAVATQFRALSQNVVANPPEDFGNVIRSDVQRWRELIRTTGYSPK
jgi:tripartite-type tricarboxylate transporter receptor subunit TctC